MGISFDSIIQELIQEEINELVSLRHNIPYLDNDDFIAIPEMVMRLERLRMKIQKMGDKKLK